MRPIVVAAFLAMSGCAFLNKAMPVIKDIAVLVSDAAQLIAVLEARADSHFLLHPNPVAQARCKDAFARAHEALNEAQRLSVVAGADNADAFRNFNEVYKELLRTLESAGVADEMLNMPMSISVPQ